METSIIQNNKCKVCGFSFENGIAKHKECVMQKYTEALGQFFDPAPNQKS